MLAVCGGGPRVGSVAENGEEWRHKFDMYCRTVGTFQTQSPPSIGLSLLNLHLFPLQIVLRRSENCFVHVSFLGFQRFNQRQTHWKGDWAHI